MYDCADFHYKAPLFIPGATATKAQESERFE